jgi:hypothetical protein
VSECQHGERRRVVGKSGKTNRWWAAEMCPDRAEGCEPAWIADQAVFAYWKAEGRAQADEDGRPF